jgi:hypothetical protein
MIISGIRVTSFWTRSRHGRRTRLPKSKRRGLKRQARRRRVIQSYYKVEVFLAV